MFDRKIHDKKYRESEKGRLADKRGQAKYRKTQKCKEKYQRYRKTEKCKITQKKWRQSKKGRLYAKKVKSLRERNLEWIPLFENPFDKSEKIEWHHINNKCVIALPKDLHQLYKTKNHRENLIFIIEQIYTDGD